MQKIKRVVAKFTKLAVIVPVFLLAGVTLVMAQPAMATVNCPSDAAKSSADTLAECYVQESKDTLMPTILNVIRAVLGVLALVTVAVIIIGGIQYATSMGEAGQVAKAKNIIIYAVIGLIISLLAFVIVNFVLTNILSE